MLPEREQKEQIMAKKVLKIEENLIPENIHLEDCPFCRGKAIIVRNPGTNWDGKQEHINKGAGFGTWYVGCPSVFFEELITCEVHPAACWNVHLKDAIKAWNSQRGVLNK